MKTSPRLWSVRATMIRRAACIVFCLPGLLFSLPGMAQSHEPASRPAASHRHAPQKHVKRAPPHRNGHPDGQKPRIVDFKMIYH